MAHDTRANDNILVIIINGLGVCSCLKRILLVGLWSKDFRVGRDSMGLTGRVIAYCYIVFVKNRIAQRRGGDTSSFNSVLFVYNCLFATHYSDKEGNLSDDLKFR